MHYEEHSTQKWQTPRGIGFLIHKVKMEEEYDKYGAVRNEDDANRSLKKDVEF